MKKALDKFGQSIGEKTGSREKTRMENDYQLMNKYSDSLKKGLDAIITATDDFIYPDGSQRGMMKLSKSKKYKHPETILANALLAASRNIGTDVGVLGDIFEYVGEVEQQIGDARSQCETDVTQMFVEPIYAYLHSDVKEVMANKKKLSSRRLDYDAKKAAHTKRNEDKTEEALIVSEGKFEESKELTMQGMTQMCNNEGQQISQLLALVEAQKAYHASALASLDSLSSYLQDRVAEADAATPYESSYTPMAAAPRRQASVRSQTGLRSSTAGAGTATALYDFVAESAAELSFREGDVITITNMIDENWVEGSLRGSHGMFPSTYVEFN